MDNEYTGQDAWKTIGYATILFLAIFVTGDYLLLSSRFAESVRTYTPFHSLNHSNTHAYTCSLTLQGTFCILRCRKNCISRDTSSQSYVINYERSLQRQQLDVSIYREEVSNPMSPSSPTSVEDGELGSVELTPGMSSSADTELVGMDMEVEGDEEYVTDADGIINNSLSVRKDRNFKTESEGSYSPVELHDGTALNGLVPTDEFDDDDEEVIDL